jgi:hypothetical protein
VAVVQLAACAICVSSRTGKAIDLRVYSGIETLSIRIKRSHRFQIPNQAGKVGAEFFERWIERPQLWIVHRHRIVLSRTAAGVSGAMAWFCPADMFRDTRKWNLSDRGPSPVFSTPTLR